MDIVDIKIYIKLKTFQLNAVTIIYNHVLGKKWEEVYCQAQYFANIRKQIICDNKYIIKVKCHSLRTHFYN
jgi:hypothetical protein